MKILVIVVGFNGMQWVDRCVSSVYESSIAADLFFVDNASSDGTADYVASRYPQAILCRNRANEGFAEGNNRGFRYAIENAYDYVYLLNQDAWLMPDTLAGLVRIHQLHPDFFILSPDQMQADLSDFDPGFKKKVVPKERVVDAAAGLSEVPFVMAAHWFISVACLRKIGLFAEIFPIYGNDDNFCHRVLFHGGHIGVATSLKAVHDKQHSALSFEKKLYRNFYMASLVQLADIRKSLLGRVLFVVALAFVKTVKYCSFKPLGKLTSIFGKDFQDVKALRRESKKTLQ